MLCNDGRPFPTRTQDHRKVETYGMNIGTTAVKPAAHPHKRNNQSRHTPEGVSIIALWRVQTPEGGGEPRTGGTRTRTPSTGGQTTREKEVFVGQQTGAGTGRTGRVLGGQDGSL